MNLTKRVAACGILAVGTVCTAQGAGTVDCTWEWSTISWSSTWTDGNTARVTAMKNGNLDWWNETISPWKIVFDTSAYSKDFWAISGDEGSRGRILIGGGGVEFAQRAVFSIGYRSNWYSGLGLNGSQTWSGTASGAYADAILGTPAYYGGYSYSLMPVTFAPAGMTWTINRNLNLWYFSHDGDGRSNLNSVNVRVEAPAHFYVAEDFTQSGGKGLPARLRAKKLTISGDGADTFPVGRTVTLPQQPTGLESTSVGTVTSLAPANVASTLELNNGADLVATKPATFAIGDLLVSGSGESVVSGAFSFSTNTVAVTFSDGATLNLAGTFTEERPGTSLSAGGTGRLVVDMANWRLTGGISAGSGVTLAIAAEGKLATPVSGAGNIEVSVGAGKMLYLPEASLAGWTGSQITVKSGTLLLDGEMQGVAVRTEAGASVAFGGGLVVTDKVRTESEINVPAGQALQIYGNGLTGATHVTLGGGTNVHFRAAATIGASMTVATGADGAWVTSYFCAPSASVTGTVAGAVCSGSGYSVVATDGPGCVIFGGGGELYSNSRFEVHGGSSAILTGGVYRVGSAGCACTYWRGTEANGTWGKYLGIRDGGRLEFAASAAERWAFFAEPLKDSANYARSATLEIGDGGTVILGNNCRSYVGGNQRSGELIISGGTMRTGTGCRICLGYNGYSVGTMRFSAGLLEISTPFYISDKTNQGLVYWTGGTLKIGSGYSSESLLTGGLMSDEATRKFSVGVLGDCTIDLSAMPGATIYNTQQMTNRGEWYGNGTLAVKGGKTICMRSMPNGMDVRLEGDGTRLVLPPDARFFDYAKCAQYCVWRRPYSSGNTDDSDNYSSLGLGLEVAGLSVPTLTVANGAPSLVNSVAARTVSVGTVSVLAGGVWDNATTVVSELAEIASLAFANDAVWHVTFAGAATVARTFASVSMPSRLGYQVSGGRSAGETALISAPAAVQEPATWFAVQPTRDHRPVRTDDGKGFFLRGPGMSIILR